MEELLPVSGDEAVVEIGGRFAGVLSLREVSGEGTDVGIGDRVVAAAVQPESPNGRVILATRRARSRRQWTRTELAKSGEIIEAEVVLASLGKLGATEPTAIPDALRGHVGKRLPLKVISTPRLPASCRAGHSPVVGGGR